ncbi:hypothetical protein EPO34_00455 [Patescibacteria group bacterium]|nr:MAG: hypothetical protein EPO34_00455 [Patescibacteria group bacterium]
MERLTKAFRRARKPLAISLAALAVAGLAAFHISPAPSVRGSVPDARVEADKNAPWRFVFDQGMWHRSVERAFKVTPPVSGAFSWQGNVLTFDPAFALEKGATFKVDIDADARNWFGKKLAVPFTQSFFVNNDPEVSVVTPANGVTVRPAQTLTMLFDRPMRALTGDLAVPDLLTMTPAVQGTYHWLGTSGFEFVPATGWAPATTYEVTLPKGLTFMDGTSLLDAYVWHFSTPALSVGLASDSTSVHPKSAVALAFNYPVKAAVVRDAITIYEQSVPRAGEPVAEGAQTVVSKATFTFVNDKDRPEQVLITKAGGLRMGTRYTFVLPEHFTGGLGPNGLSATWSQTVTTDELGFRVLRACPESGGTKRTDRSVLFVVNNQADEETFKTGVNVVPELENVEIGTYGYDRGCKGEGGRSVSVYGRWKPSTTYTITLSRGLKDIYGQPLENPQTHTITTDPYPARADLTGYSAYGVLASHLPRVYQVRTINMKEPVKATLCALPLEGYVKQGGTDCQPIGEKTYETNGPLNGYKVIDVDLDEIAGSRVSTGMYRLDLTMPGATNFSYHNGKASRYLLVTDTALTVKRDKAGKVLVWATDMKTGLGIEGLDASIHNPEHVGDGAVEQIDNARTDADGLATLEVKRGERHNLAIRAQGNGHFGFVNQSWDDGISPWNFGLDTSYGNKLSRDIGYLYTDRRIYRPDQLVYFKGVVRKDVDAILGLPDEKEVEVTFHDPNGTQVGRQTLPVSKYGTFNGAFQLDPSMALGSYQFAAALKGESIYGRFDVREFRRPDFKVTITPPSGTPTAGDVINVPIHGEYYYGVALAGATVEYSLTRRALYYQPMRGEWYSFTETDDSYCYWYCRMGGDLETVKTGTATLDQNGDFVLSVPASLTDYKTSATYALTATVTDVNQRSVSANGEFDVHKGDFYVGIRSDYSDGWQSPTAAFDLVTLFPDGTPLAGATGTVELYKRSWTSVKKEGTDGVPYTDWVKDDAFVASVPFTTDAEAKAHVSFVPEKDGEYVAVAKARDRRGREITASVSRWVERGRGASVRVSDDHVMKVIQNKADYAVGDTASLVVQLPYEKVKALVTIERDTIRKSFVVDLGSDKKTIEIPIDDAMTPNVYVSVIAVQGGGETGIPEFRIGYANLQVDTARKALDLSVKADKAVYRPGNTVTLEVDAKRSDGSPASAEVSIAVVDERVVSLLGSIDKDILGKFWFPRSIGVTTAQTLTQLTKKIFTDTEGGGGKGGEESPAVRGNFLDTALWKADVVTDGNGKATISFPLPDNLTSWQVLAIGETKDTVVGSAETKIVTRRDLMVEPLLPRLVRTGDTVTFGATVFNNTDTALNAVVELAAEGVTVDGARVRNVFLPAKSRRALSWAVQVPMTSSEAKVRVTGKGGGFEDGFETTLPVRGYAVAETVSASNLFGRAATETIELPEGILPDVGQVKASVTSNVGTGLVSAIDYLVKYGYGCAEQTASALLGSLTYEQLVAAKLAKGNDALGRLAHDKVDGAIKKLVSTQRPDGAWGFWPEAYRAYPHLTAYVFWALTQAQQAGYAVSDEALDRADQYLRNYLASPGNEKSVGLSMNERAQVLFMLAERDSGNLGGYAATVYEERNSLTAFGRSFLAMALVAIDGPGSSRAKTVLDDVKSKVIYINPSTAYVSEDTGYDDYFMGSDARTTSLYLQALLRISPKDDDVDRLMRYLVSKKVDGYWYSTQGTAMTLSGLLAYVKRHPVDTEALSVKVYLDDALAETLAFDQGDLSGERSVVFPIAELLKDGATHDFTFKKDSEKRYFYDLSSTIYRQIEDIEPFDNGFTVLAGVYAVKDTKYAKPLSEARQGDTVRVHMKLLVPKEHRNVSLEYHLPAGLEPIDFSLLTSPQDVSGEQRQCVPDWSGETYCMSDWEYGWWWENAWKHIEQRDDRVFLFSEDLQPGIYEYDFLATAVTPGTFRVPPARAYEFYDPLANGHNEGKLFRVTAP